MNNITRYVFISDPHGRFDKLKTVLDAVAFDASKDTIVSLGDLFDRGDQSLEILKYVMSCPNRILIWGNHDFRLRELILRGGVSSADYSNGVLATLHSFCPNHKGVESIDMLLQILQSDSQYEDTYRLLW